MSDNHNIDTLRAAMELIEEKRESLTEEQREEIDKNGSIEDIEKAFKEYDDLVATLQSKLRTAFK